jgi:glutamate carboxypeptidase
MTPTTDPAVAPAELDTIRAAVEDARQAYLADLERLVNLDCGSYTKDGVDEVGRWVRARLESLGASVTVHPNDLGLGDTVIGELAGNDPTGPTLLAIGHMDTVFDPGTAADRPFAIDDKGIARGPGVTDMKSGLLAGLYALAALRDTVGLPLARVVFVANPDEEIGSPASTAHIRRVAADADACLVLECARMNGDIVSSRKGNAGIRVTVHGRASHAGIEPEKGRNSILEAARMVTALQALNGTWPGVTVNVGTIEGGTRPNVVPAECSLEIDLRSTSREALETAEAAVREIARPAIYDDITTDVELTGRHWPMEKLERSGRLVGHAVALAGALGFELHDAATGGASDANTTAGMGIPTIDGLGPIGGYDHSPDEYLETASIVPRTTLLAALITAIGRDPDVRSWRLERESNATGSEDLA